MRRRADVFERWAAAHACHGTHCAMRRCDPAGKLRAPTRSGSWAIAWLPPRLVCNSSGRDASVFERWERAITEAASMRGHADLVTCRAGARRRRRDEAAPDTEGECEGPERPRKSARARRACVSDIRIERTLASDAAARTSDFIAATRKNATRTRGRRRRGRVASAAGASVRRLSRSNSPSAWKR